MCDRCPDEAGRHDNDVLAAFDWVDGERHFRRFKEMTDNTNTPMSPDEYIAQIKLIQDEELRLTARKNADYGDGADALANFRLIETITAGRISMADGVLVRMTDKLMRIAHLQGRAAQVEDESITDSCEDLANYSNILALIHRTK